MTTLKVNKGLRPFIYLEMKKILYALVVLLAFVPIAIGASITAERASAGGSSTQAVCETIAWGNGRVSSNGYLPYLGSVVYDNTNDRNFDVGYNGWISSFKAYGIIVSGSYFGTPSCNLRINGGSVTNGTINIGLGTSSSDNGFRNYAKNAVTVAPTDKLTAFWNNAGGGSSAVGCQVVVCRDI